MKLRTAEPNTETKARRWARRLSMRVKGIVAAHPGVDPDNIRHTLFCWNNRRLPAGKGVSSAGRQFG